LPGVADTTVPVNDLFPVSGWFTSTEYVMVAVAPIRRLPVQPTVDALKETVPLVAAASFR